MKMREAEKGPVVRDVYTAAYLRLHGLHCEFDVKRNGRVDFLFGPEANEPLAIFNQGARVEMSGGDFIEHIKQTKKEMYEVKKTKEKEIKTWRNL